MNQHLQTLLNFIQRSETLSSDEKDSFSISLKAADKELAIIAFKLDRTEKVKRTTAILLEETIEELEQKRRTIEDTNQALQKSLGELKATQAQLIQSEKLASLGELTAGIAHEMQNPLNFVNNFSELSVDLVTDLKEEIEKPSPDKAYISEIFDDLLQNQEKINLHGKRASSIVKSMLEHSRAGTGIKELTDINKLADEYLRLSYHGLRAIDNSFNSDISTYFDENLPEIEVIPQDMGRVLLNLINNAFYAVNEKSREGIAGYKPTVSVITLLVSPLGNVKVEEKIQISIKDNGNGIPQNIRDKIFQPFFTTKPTGQGAGLGLSITYDIVKAHGGELRVETEEKEGSEFIIQWPINAR